jgi:hypothetical protein
MLDWEDEEYIPMVREIRLAVHSDLRQAPIVRAVKKTSVDGDRVAS